MDNTMMMDMATQDPDLAAIGADVDQALTAYEADIKQLQATQDVYAPAEVQRRRGAADALLYSRLDSRFADGDTLVQKRLDEARRQMAMAERDPVEALSAADLQRASQLAPFVREAVDGLSLADLTAELQRRRLAGDRVALALWVRYTMPVMEQARIAGAAQGRGLDYDGQALDIELATCQEALVDEQTRKAVAKAKTDEQKALAFKAGLREIKSRDPRYQASVRQRFGLS